MLRKILKWVGIVLGGLIGLIVLALVVVLAYGQMSFHKKVDRPVYAITADTSPEGVARGEYLVRDVIGCVGCHGPLVAEGQAPDPNAPLAGHSEPVTFGPLSGNFAPPNLTPDKETGLGNWTDGEIARAIREGLDKDGVVLSIMPAYEFHTLSDADVAAIVGYLRSLAPLRNEVPAVTFNLPGKAMFALGILTPPNPTAPITDPVPAPAPGTAEAGKYIVSIIGCVFCHGENLAGGPYQFQEAGTPPAANLTPAGELVGWSEADFVTALTTGQKPDGRTLDETMPWKEYGRMKEEDLKAIFAYLKTLPAAESKK